MGKSSSRPQATNFHFDENDWEQISPGMYQLQDEPITFRSKITGELVDAYYPSFISKK